MPAIMTHHGFVQPIVRLDVTTSVIFSGEIDGVVACPVLEVVLEQEEIVGTVEEQPEVVATVDQDELVATVEQEDC